jgi:hypothetical protein
MTYSPSDVSIISTRPTYVSKCSLGLDTSLKRVRVVDMFWEEWEERP